MMPRLPLDRRHFKIIIKLLSNDTTLFLGCLYLNAKDTSSLFSDYIRCLPIARDASFQCMGRCDTFSSFTYMHANHSTMLQSRPPPFPFLKKEICVVGSNKEIYMCFAESPYSGFTVANPKSAVSKLFARHRTTALYRVCIVQQ